MAFIKDEAPWPGGKVSQRVICIRANNPSPMTYTGTNTWIVAEPGSKGCVVIDPAPEGTHIDHILEVCEEQGWSVGAIVATHSHPDHINGIPQLAAATGAPVYAADPERVVSLLSGAEGGAGEREDGAGLEAVLSRAGAKQTESRPGQDWAKAQGLEGIEVVDLSSGRFCPFEGAPEFEAVPLPGHSSDSMGLLLPSEQALFTGDVLFRHGPTVVLYPDGSLARYLDSLDTLEELVHGGEVQRFYPAHGWPIEEPLQIIQATRQHRKERLQQVRDAIAQGTPAQADALFDTVYAGVDPRLKPASVRSIQAQLEYLGYPAGPE